jgi:hypothetical protein
MRERAQLKVNEALALPETVPLETRHARLKEAISEADRHGLVDTLEPEGWETLQKYKQDLVIKSLEKEVKSRRTKQLSVDRGSGQRQTVPSFSSQGRSSLISERGGSERGSAATSLLPSRRSSITSPTTPTMIFPDNSRFCAKMSTGSSSKALSQFAAELAPPIAAWAASDQAEAA